MSKFVSSLAVSEGYLGFLCVVLVCRVVLGSCRFRYGCVVLIVRGLCLTEHSLVCPLVKELEPSDQDPDVCRRGYTTKRTLNGKVDCDHLCSPFPNERGDVHGAGGGAGVLALSAGLRGVSAKPSRQHREQVFHSTQLETKRQVRSLTTRMSNR